MTEYEYTWVGLVYQHNKRCMAYLAAISASAGVPLFIRTKGDVPPLSFPTVGSLNGVHVFASNLKTSLLSCTTGGAKVVWKSYCDSITLILVAPEDSPTHVHNSHLLDLIFNAMVLLVGLHELERISNVERLKKDLKCCFPLIDHLLCGGGTVMCPLTQCVDTVAVDDTAILQSSVDGFAEACESNYGCLSVCGRVCVATGSWWKLAPIELSLLSLLLCSLPPSSCRDIPVYLPKASNKVAHRLLVFSLLQGMEVSVLCSAEPSLGAVQRMVEGYWSGVTETLRSCVRFFPRCVPLSLHFDPSVLAFCLVNLDSHRSITSLRPSTAPDSYRSALTQGFRGEMDLGKRHNYLVRFYKTVVDNLLPVGKTTQDSDGSDGTPSSPLHRAVPHRIVETYTCTKRYKAYAMHRDQHNIFVLFTSTTPTFALRKLTSDVLNTLIEGKSVSV